MKTNAEILAELTALQAQAATLWSDRLNAAKESGTCTDVELQQIEDNMADSARLWDSAMLEVESPDDAETLLLEALNLWDGADEGRFIEAKALDLLTLLIPPHLVDEDEDNIRKARFLAATLGCSLDTIELESGRTWRVDGAEYLVCDEAERDEEWESSLDSYLEDCILDELDGVSRQYFDCEAWKRDARMDDAGHSLSSYDGNEHEGQVDGVWYWAYRTN